jgi:cell division protease FtsH
LEGAVEYSGATAEMIDDEVREILSAQYSKALEILREKKGVLEKGALLLLKEEKIEGDQLKALIDELSGSS